MCRVIEEVVAVKNIKNMRWVYKVRFVRFYYCVEKMYRLMFEGKVN